MMNNGYQVTIRTKSDLMVGELYVHRVRRKGEIMLALIAGQLVRHKGHLYEVTSVFNTNTEGWVANITRTNNNGTVDRRSVPTTQCEGVN